MVYVKIVHLKRYAMKFRSFYNASFKEKKKKIQKYKKLREETRSVKIVRIKLLCAVRQEILNI